MKININRFGHYDYKALEDNIEMLKSVLVDCDHEVKLSNKISQENINFFYEGHNYHFYNKLLEILKIKSKKVLICTEEISYSYFLPKNFFTFNDHKILYNNSKNIYYYPFFKLLLLNLQVFVHDKLLKLHTKWHKRKTPLKEYSDKVRKKISLNESDLYWKQRYNFFLKILNYFDGVISTYDKINYKFLKIGNYIFLPHSFCKKDLLIKNKNIYKDKNYKYDFIFTGQLNSYRNELIKQISKYAKIKIIGISSNKKEINI